MNFLFIVIFILAFAGMNFGQNPPVIKQTGKITKASNLRGEVKHLTCSKKQLTVEGEVINRNFEQDETSIGSFEVRAGGGKRLKIYLNVKQLELLGDHSAVIVNSLIANGRKVKVAYSDCSSNSRNFNFAETITAF